MVKHVPIGTRVVVRSHFGDGAVDALGIITARTSDAITVDTRRGATTVLLDDVVAARTVPPPPAGRR